MNAESIGKLSFWLNILFMFSSLISLLVRKFIVISCGGALSQAYMKCLLLAGSDNNICHYLRFRYCCFKISKLSFHLRNNSYKWHHTLIKLKFEFKNFRWKQMIVFGCKFSVFSLNFVQHSKSCCGAMKWKLLLKLISWIYVGSCIYIFL